MTRQVKRWSAQYEASKTDDLPAMDNLMAWLADHIPDDDSAAIAHGDFRLGNLLVDNQEPRVVAVLDWELATIGHPWRTWPIAACRTTCPTASTACAAWTAWI